MKTTRTLSFSLIGIACASGQSLSDLAPANEASGSLPLAWTLSGAIGYDDNPTASNWLSENSESESQQAAFASITNEWAPYDPEDIRRWINSLSPSLQRDPEIETYVRDAAREGSTEAIEWANSSNSDQDQLEELARVWARSEPAAARAWLDSINPSIDLEEARSEAIEGIRASLDDPSRRRPRYLEPADGVEEVELPELNDDIPALDTEDDPGTVNQTRKIESSFQVGYSTDYVFRGLNMTKFEAINAVQTVFLVTDAALALDDRSGFETSLLKASENRFDIATSTHQTQSGISKRRTNGLRADLDVAISDHFFLGGELIYASGEIGQSEFDSISFGLDAAFSGTYKDFDWEIGGGLGATSGDLKRYDSIDDQMNTSNQLTGVLTVHAAFRKTDFSILGMDSYVEFGLKERLVYRDSSSEDNAITSSISHGSETFFTTLANLELGVKVTDKVFLNLSLNPVLFHSDGDITVVSEDNSYSTFTLSNPFGYDVHTARAGLRAIINDTTTFNTNVIVGNDSTWGASIGFLIDL